MELLKLNAATPVWYGAYKYLPEESIARLPLPAPPMAKGDPLTGVRLPVFWLIEKTLMFVPAESVTSRNFPEAAVSILPVMNRERSESGVDARAVSIPLLSIENA